jgi:hypothetical protein
MMKRITSTKLPLNPKLAEQLASFIPKSLTDESVVLNFRDSNYSPETGGYHPVEISLRRLTSNQWQISYITDFCFVGQGDFAELAKCLDFDIGQNVYQDLYQCTELSAGLEMFKLWQTNFMAYLKMEVFEITASKL